MRRDKRLTRRRFLAATGAVIAAPALLAQAGGGKPQLKPVPDDQIKKIEAAIPRKATVKPKKQRKLLVFYRCDGFVHGSIAAGNEALTRLGKATGAYDTVVSKDTSVFDPGGLDGFDAVMFNNTTRLKIQDPKRRKTLMDFVKGGRGVCGGHAATDNFYDWPEAAAMMGGLFDGHPWGGGGTWAVKIDEPDHPINRGFGGKGFWIKDEIYKLRDPYSRESLRVLVSLDMDKRENRPGRPDRDNAISWIRNFGKGRVFYCSLGHNNHVFWTPSVLQHYLDGIQFAMGDLKADATPSAELATKPTSALAPPK